MRRRLTARPALGALLTQLAAAALASALLASTAGAAVTGTRDALMIVVQWEAGAAPGAPADVAPSELTASMTGVVNPYMASVSRGQFLGWEADGVGPYTIANPGSCDDEEDFVDRVAERAEAAAVADGHDPDDYDNVVFYFSAPARCVFLGKADRPGRHAWLQGKGSLQGALVHELGHNLGLGHSAVKICGTVPLRADCAPDEAGDVYSAMGRATSRSFAAAQQEALGWLGQRHLDVTIPDDPQHLILQPLEDSGLTIQALHLVDGGTDYWIELRAPLGVDVPGPTGTPVPGVLVRQSAPGDQTHTFLLDMSPALAPGTPGNIFDAGLPPGRSWSNPLGTLRLTVNSVGPLGADVTIESNLPRVPDVTWLRLQEASSTLGAAGYSIGRTSYVVDATCNFIGRVKSQQPGAGNRVPTTEPIDLVFGTRPAGGCQ